MLRNALTAVHSRHFSMLTDTAVSADDLQSAEITLRRLERFWSHASELAQRSPLAA
jgi:hypothetical protein